MKSFLIKGTKGGSKRMANKLRENEKDSKIHLPQGEREPPDPDLGFQSLRDLNWKKVYKT